VTASGAVLEPLSPVAVRRAVAAVRRAGAESVAVALLHAYANGAHERRLGRALAASGIDVTLAHELVGEYREYERTSTAVMNAYVAPVMRRHLQGSRAAAARGVAGAAVERRDLGGHRQPRGGADAAIRASGRLIGALRRRGGRGSRASSPPTWAGRPPT
jgi:N-methylhydantoinase A